MKPLLTIHLILTVLSPGAIVGFAVVPSEPPPDIRVTDAPRRQVEVRSGNRVVWHSPEEGLWSIATEWQKDWPADWRHASPTKVERMGDWTVASGALVLPQGVVELSDAYRLEGSLIRGVRRFTWKGAQDLPRCTLSVRWLVPGARGAKPLLPGILYYGNPSGARTGAGAVAVAAGKPGEESIYEEHRYPVPFASLEWNEAAGGSGAGWRGAALHVIPSLVAGANRPDQWWSLGVAAREQATELVLLSGPCASNGRHGVVKARQDKFLEYPDVWMRLRPGMVVEKTFFLEAYPVARQGAGFQTPLRTALRRYGPFSLQGLPNYEQTIRDKYRFACSRFRDREQDPGFEMFPDFVVGTHYVMGWCGQAAAAGAALLTLDKRLGDPRAVSMAVRSLNHLATAPFNANGFLLKYTVENHSWSDQDPVSQGQAMENFARAILAGRTRGDVDAKSWERFLKKACEIHAARILRDDWHPGSTAEAFFVSPLCKGFTLFGNADFKAAALKAADHYAGRHADMTEPYWGGTLDARCEDKEGALAALQAFLAAYELTKEARYLARAEHAMDVALTYTVVWDMDLPPGRLRDHDLRTRGWTVVSAQNQHLDVFAVLYTPEIWRMGGYLRRDELKQLAAVMYRSCGQLVDAYGSQGEQIQHTNFAQQGDMSDVSKMRGGYSEGWTVFWITAHFLNAAAEFERMGVDLDEAGGSPARRSARLPAGSAAPGANFQ